MTSTMDDIITEAMKQYSKMSLLELLAYENAMNKLLYSEGFKPNNNLRILYEILRTVIDKRLR